MIKLKKPNYRIESQTDLVKFLEKYFNFNTPATVYVDTNEKQCKGGARRSIGDLFNLYKYYNPDSEISKDDVILALDKIKTKLCNIYCYNTGKMVYTDSNICIRYCGDVKAVVCFINVPGYDDWNKLTDNITILTEFDKFVGHDDVTIDHVIKILKKKK